MKPFEFHDEPDLAQTSIFGLFIGEVIVTGHFDTIPEYDKQRSGP